MKSTWLFCKILNREYNKIQTANSKVPISQCLQQLLRKCLMQSLKMYKTFGSQVIIILTLGDKKFAVVQMIENLFNNEFKVEELSTLFSVYD